MKALGLIPFLLLFCLFIFSLSMTVYGIYLAFSASILLGILALVIEPTPFVFGAAMFLFDKNIPEAIMQWLNS